MKTVREQYHTIIYPYLGENERPGPETIYLNVERTIDLVDLVGAGHLHSMSLGDALKMHIALGAAVNILLAEIEDER